jgi:hypothetical protein
MPCPRGARRARPVARHRPRDDQPASVQGVRPLARGPTVSIAIVCLTALAAWAAFEERLQPRMLAGLATGVLAIVLVNL